METMLTMLKTDLGIRTSTAYDARLTQLLIAAQQAIIKEGVSTLGTSKPLDMQLIVMYAAYLYRKRATDEPMPRMLRWALNNRIFSEKMKEDEA